MDVKKLAEEIIAGKRLTRQDDLSFFLTCDLKELQEGADLIRKHFCGDKVDLCTIINGKSGRCGENCKYCAQSAHNKTGIEEYPFLCKDKIVNEALANESEGVDRFAIVTAGRGLMGEDFEKAITRISKPPVASSPISAPPIPMMKRLSPLSWPSRRASACAAVAS